MKWFQQLVHHDIWDYDLAAAPTLFDVRRNGRVDSRGGAADEDGAAVHLQSRNRRADLRHGRAPGAADHRARRMDVADAAVSGQARAARAQLAQAVASCPRSRRSTRPSARGCGTSTSCRTRCRTTRGSGQDIVVFPGAQGGGNWHGVDVQQAARPDHHERDDRGAVGTSRAGRPGRARRRGAPPRPKRRAGRTPRCSHGARARRRRRRAAAMSKVTPEGGRFWDPAKHWTLLGPAVGRARRRQRQHRRHRVARAARRFQELAAKGIKTGTPSSAAAITTAGNLVFIGATIDGYFRAFDARNGRAVARQAAVRPRTPSRHLHGPRRQAVRGRARRRGRLPAKSDRGHADRVRVAR